MDRVRPQENARERRSGVGVAQPQFRLTVGAVDDPLEREADVVADRIVRQLAASPTRFAAGSEPAGLVSRIQRRGVGAEGGQIDAATESAIESARSGGSGLPASVKPQLEAAFDTDLSAVRLHVDSRAGELNRALSAEAFTTGSDIFFRSGPPDLAGSAGRHLLAHELTHVVQQRPAGVARRKAGVVRRVVWTPADVAVKAALSAELRDGLQLAVANPDALPAGPAWLRNRLIAEDEQVLANKAADPTLQTDAQKKWDALPSGAKSKLDEVTWVTASRQKVLDTARAGQNARVNKEMTQRLSGKGPPPDEADLGGKFKWKETFKNSDGDLPGLKGGGGYHEYYAQPDPADPPNAGFWGRNRVLHNVTVGEAHSGSWWVTADHYQNYRKVTDA